MARQLVILAGGRGSRLRERLGDLPKPLIPIAGKPLIEHQIELAARHRFQDVLILTGYRSDLIEAHLGKGDRWGLRIECLREIQPLGTAGAVLAGLDRLDDQFLILYGDTMVNVDLERVWRAHQAGTGEAGNQPWDATLLLHPNDHPLDSDLVELDEAGRVTAFHNRPHSPGVWRQNLVNAGLYVLKRKALEPFRPSTITGGPAGLLDFGKDLFPKMLEGGARLLGYQSPEYIKDVGTPERYDRVNAEYAAGVVQRGSLDTPQRTVFLDRDGTLVVDKDCLRTAEDLEMLPGVGKGIRELNHHGWRTVVVTNQPVLAKGWCTEAELKRMHDKLETLLGRERAFLDRIYYCPHHPDSGFEGERPELKIHCACRKPAPGMIDRAATDLNIDLARSWLVGDTTTDVQTAHNAGLKSVLVRTGAGGADGKYPVRPDQVCDNLLDAVAFILEHSPA
jgi:histidinol-phosphate phosphatase family protein